MAEQSEPNIDKFNEKYLFFLCMYVCKLDAIPEQMLESFRFPLMFYILSIRVNVKELLISGMKLYMFLTYLIGVYHNNFMYNLYKLHDKRTIVLISYNIN